MNSNPDNTTTPTSARELMVLAAATALAAASIYATFDFLHRAPAMTPQDVMIATLLAGVPAVLGSLVAAVISHAVLALLGGRLPRERGTALLVGAQVMLLCAAVVLVATKNYRDWSGLLLLVATVPVAAATFTLLDKARRAGSRPLGILALALSFSLLLTNCGIAAVHAWKLPAALLAGPPIAGLAILVGATRASARAPKRVAAAVLLGLAATVALSAFFGAPAIPPSTPDVQRADTRPNVVLIVLDTLRRDRLGCYGHPAGLTPVLDRLAREGVVYEQAISAAPWTVPSHASMFTGLFPVSHGCTYTNHLWLDDEFLTLAESLGDLGYQTVALNGNVAMVDNNLFQGFDEIVWLDGPYDWTSVFRLARFAGTPQHWADKGCREADAALGRWLDRRDTQVPFFLFINLYEVHDPYLPPLAERRAHLSPEAGILAASLTGMNVKPLELHVQRKNDPPTSRIVTGLYDAAVRYQDSQLGELIGRLGRAIDLDDALLIVTSDHGENLGEEGRWGHLQSISEALIHVPLIIRYPNRFPAGTRISGLCQTTDLPATVFDLLGVDCPLPGASPRSLVPDRFAPADYAYAQVAPFYGALDQVDRLLGFRASDARFRADLRVIRTESLKFIWSSDGRHRLYDIVHDPDEAHNLMMRLTDRATALDLQLANWWDRQPRYVSPRLSDEAAAPLDEKTLERLRALGYVGD